MNLSIESGKTSAASHSVFVSAYRIVKAHDGTRIDGISPDGRYTGTCDRCGTAILNVYVFRNEAKTSTMHVGIDCAQKMGVALDQLKVARGWWREQERMASRAVREASRAARAELERQEREARLAANSAVVEELEALASDDCATPWEEDQLRSMIGSVASHGTDWMEHADDENEWCAVKREILACVRDRLSLCATSAPVTGDKKGAITGEWRAYRKPVVIEPFAYGRGCTYINFLTDDKGSAFVYKGSKMVYKGSKMVCSGEKVRGTFSVEEAETRDGLTSTHLKRPRKAELFTQGEWRQW